MSIPASSPQPGSSAGTVLRRAPNVAGPLGGWHDLGPTWAIPPGEGRVFEIGAARVAVFRTRAGELFASQAQCSHRGGPLADGIVGGATVVCPLHAFKFDLTTGKALGHGCASLTTYPVQLGPAGHILLSLAPHAPADEPASDEETTGAAPAGGERVA